MKIYGQEGERRKGENWIKTVVKKEKGGDMVIDQKLSPFLMIFSAIFFDYSSLNLILVCLFKFRKSKKQ